MTKKIIFIPTLGDTPSDFKKLFEVGTEAYAAKSDICFNFSTCKSLKPNAVVFLGGLARLHESKGVKTLFDWYSLKSEIVRSMLSENSFADAFNLPFQKNLKDVIYDR